MLCLLIGTELVLVFGLERLFLLLNDKSVDASIVSVISESISIINFVSMVNHVQYNNVSRVLLNSYIFTGFIAYSIDDLKHKLRQRGR